MNSSMTIAGALSGEWPAHTPQTSAMNPAKGPHVNRCAGWLEPPALTLDPNGVIVDCSELGEAFFGYPRGELAQQHVSRVLPQLAGMELLQNGELNAYFSFLCRIGHPFRVTPRSGHAFPSRLSMVRLPDAGRPLVRLIAQSSRAVSG